MLAGKKIMARLLAGVAVHPVPAAGIGPGSPCVGATTRCTATLRVPLDRAHPEAGTITVPYTWVPHRDRGRRSAGVIAGLDGGPEAVLAGTEDSVPRIAAALGPVLADHDLLVVERRGFGDADLLRCNDLAVARPDTVAACARRGQYDNTAARVADVDAARRALGVPTLTLYGLSYGTVDAAAYAARFPAHTAAAVLDSPSLPVDPRTGYTRYWDVQSSLDGELAALPVPCRASAACRRLPGTAAGRMAAVAARLRAHPDPQLSFLRLASVARTDPIWLHQQANGALAAYLAGDPAPLHRLAALAGPPPGAPQDADSMLRPHGSAYLAYICNDTAFAFDRSADTATRRAQLAAHRRAHPEHPISTAEFSGGYGGFDDWCTGWTTPHPVPPPVPAGARLPRIPVLAIAGELDGNAPRAARTLAARFGSGARTLVVPFGTHVPTVSATTYTPCVDAALRGFLTDPRRTVTAACGGENFRAAGRFPHSRAELPATAVPGLAAAFATAADATVPYNPDAAPAQRPATCPGLRGGTVTADPARHRLTLHADSYLAGVPVSGTITLTAAATAELTVDGHRIVLAWQPFQARDRTRVTGTADGHPFAASLSTVL